MPELKEIIAPIVGKQRKFFLLRVADMGVDEAVAICKVKKSAYYSWMQNEVFTDIYRQRDELSIEHRHEAIALLRRENQLAAVLLEGEVIEKITEEVKSGDYQLIKTRLAGDVYSKLVNDLDMRPIVQNLTWEQRINNLFNSTPTPIAGSATPALNQGGTPIDAEFIEATGGQEVEHSQSELVPQVEQGSEQAQEAIQA